MNLLNQFSQITTFIFDVDGVLTDGGLYIQDDGILLRKMNAKDGYAMQLAVKQGLQIVIISGGNSNGAALRLQKLGIKHVYISIIDKAALLKELIEENNWQKENLLYMGDDIPDIEVMHLCGIKACPNDAVEDILQIADYISPKNGGAGCVRDVIEKVMKLKKLWPL